MWPFIEARVTGDHRNHELLDRPRERPVRTAIGTGVLTFYIVLFGAGSQDIFAQHLNASIPDVNRTFRVLLLVAPLAVAGITWKWCHDLLRQPDDEDDGADRAPRGAALGPTRDDRHHSSRHDVEASSLVDRVVIVAAVGAGIIGVMRRRRK